MRVRVCHSSCHLPSTYGDVLREDGVLDVEDRLPFRTGGVGAAEYFGDREISTLLLVYVSVTRVPCVPILSLFRHLRFTTDTEYTKIYL